MEKFKALLKSFIDEVEDQHEMLHGIGKNWATDLTPREKNGTFVFKGKVVDDFEVNFATINGFVDKGVWGYLTPEEIKEKGWDKIMEQEAI